MKKSLLILTAALTFGMAAAQTAAPASAPQVPTLTDVPAGHWAKDAIDKLVSRGIILGYPDGTFRGTQNLTRYEAAVIIARLLDQMAQNPGGTGIDDDTLASLQNAIQELAADLAALGVRVTDLEENAVSRDDFTRLEDRIETLALQGGDPTAAANIQAQLDELTARADEYDTLRADVDDNASSIAALNDLTVLLNQDILNLQDRVSAVEAAQADFVMRADFDNLSGRVGAIDTRVTKLEGAPKFTVSGAINAQYGRINLVSGSTNFDVDRLTRQTFMDGVFSRGSWWCNGSPVYSVSGNAASCIDTNNNVYNGWGIFGINASNLSTADGKFVVNNASVNFYFDDLYNLSNPVTPRLDNVSMNGTLNGQKFDVRYEPYRSSFKFNDLLFANDNDTDGTDTISGQRGIVANIQADQLPLKPKLTIVAGTATPFATSGLDGRYYGLRASVNPADAGTFGVSFAQMDGGSTYTGRSALGLDWDTKFGPVSLTGAGVVSSPNTNSLINSNFTTVWNNADKAFYTDAKADLGIVKLGANFHAISPNFADGVAGMSANDAAYWQGTRGSLPYGTDMVGYGAGLGTNLGPIALGAFVDSDTDWAGTSNRYLNFGVAAGVKLAGFSLKGFYNQSKEANNLISVDGNYFAYNSTTPYMDVADVPFAYSSTFGGVLKHDGAADNALIKGLNFTVADAYFYESELKANDLQIYGNYSGSFGGVKIEPFVRYHLFTTPSNAVKTDTGNNSLTGGNLSAQTYNTFKYGVKLSTQPMTMIPLQPSLYFNFANRATNLGTSMQFATPSASELFGQVGISLNQFLVPNMKASVGYAYYQGFNVANTITASSASGATATYSAAADRIYASPFSGGGTPFGGDNFGTARGKLDGIYAQADWLGLAANYGVFRYTDLSTNATSVAHGFKVSYTFKF